MKFLQQLEKVKKDLLLEADQAPLPPGADATAQANPTPQEVQAGEAPAPEAPEATEPETESLAPESEVMLIRLLKKAFVIAPKPEDIELISEVGEVNETNARECLKKIVNLMKRYSSDIDID